MLSPFVLLFPDFVSLPTG